MSRSVRTLALVVAAGAVVLSVVLGHTALSQAQAPAQVLQVEMKEFTFVPKTLTIKPGAVRIVAVNKGIVEHNFVVMKVKNATTNVVKAGKSGNLDVTLTAGTYQIVCDVPGHKEAGMVATLVVK